MRRRLIFAVVVALLLVGAAALLRAPLVPAVPVVRGAAVEAVYASGTVEPALRAEVRARASGPLFELDVHEGEQVKQGQLLARIDAPALGFEAQKGSADRDAARARKATAPQLEALRAQEQGLVAQRAEAQGDVARAEELVRTGVKPPAELERARTHLASAKSQLEANQAQQRDVGMLLDADVNRSTAGAASLAARASDAEVRAPIDGTILLLRIERGETVVQNQSLLRVGDLSRLHVEAQVDEADVGRVAVGTQALIRIAAFEERPLAGTVVRVAPEADRERKSFQIDLELAQPPEGLRPGMTVEVNLLTRRHDGALLVPAEALAADASLARGAGRSAAGAHTGLLRVVREGRAVQVPVQLGIRDLERVEVLGDAIHEGELVLLEQAPLADGARVRPQLVPRAEPVLEPPKSEARR